MLARMTVSEEPLPGAPLSAQRGRMRAPTASEGASFSEVVYRRLCPILNLGTEGRGERHMHTLEPWVGGSPYT